MGAPGHHNLSAIVRAREHFRAAGGTLRARAATEFGIHSRTLQAMRESGELVALSRGVYRLTEAGPPADPDLAIIAQRVPAGVVCLVSALSHHGLTLQIPHEVDLALPRGARTPVIEGLPIRVFRFGAASFEAGVETCALDGGTLRVYSAAKTVADCFKFRNRIGLDVAIEGLKLCLHQSAGTVDDLLRFAEINRVRKVMMPYVEAVL